MVITRKIKGKKYYGHWENSKAKALAFGKKMVKEGLSKRFIVTKNPKKNYKF